jgi:UDP-glucose:glycoprotein glucosyltransferase
VDGQSIAPPLLFTDLPSEPIYTLGMDTPPSWITRPVASPYDLDNLLLSNVHEPVQVDFQLKQLVVEGHAREGGNAPPRGLQLQLSDIATPTSGGQVASDTLVMANLGYFQFKVTPGVYDLSIRPGRGEEVYELQSTGTGGWDSKLVNETGTSITLASFDGVTILPRFGRRKGMEMANVLDEARVQSQQDEGYMQKVFSKYVLSGNEREDDSSQAGSNLLLG